MNEIISFLSENFPLLLVILIGYFIANQELPISSLISGAIFITPQEVVKMMNSDTILIDARSESDYFSGHIKGSIHLYLDASSVKSRKTKDNVILCLNENESGVSYIKQLRKLGYTNIYLIKGGYEAWINDSFPVVKRRAK